MSNNIGTLYDESGNNFYPHSASGDFIQEFTVDGDADTFYPVLFSNSERNNSGNRSFAEATLNVYRQYNWTAPDTWYTSTHRGGLTLSILWNGDYYWGGNQGGPSIKILHLNQSYSTMFTKYLLSTSGLVLWLRGGGALYRFSSNKGAAITATVHLEEFTDSASQTFSPTTDATVSANHTLLRKIPMLDEIYPVGSVYMSVNSTSPANLFGRNLDEYYRKISLGNY